MPRPDQPDHPDLPEREPRGFARPGAQRRESSGFVWPPKAPTATPSDDARPAADESDSGSGLPTTDDRGVLQNRFGSLLRTRESVAARVLEACELEFLDLTIAPLPRRARDHGWQPDLPGDYCPRCGRSARRGQVDALGCPACTSRRLPFEKLIRLGSYEDLLRDMVHEVKFDKRRTLGAQLGKLLGVAVQQELERARVSPDSVVIVPMPTTFLRRTWRGIDHALVLARAVRAVTGGRICRPISKRHRPSQLEVNPSEREANMARAFRPGRVMPWGMPALAGKVVIVVDDVTTTGATLRGACRAVHSAWRRSLEGQRPTGVDRPRIWAAVLGVTPSAIPEAGVSSDERQAARDT